MCIDNSSYNNYSIGNNTHLNFNEACDYSMPNVSALAGNLDPVINCNSYIH